MQQGNDNQGYGNKNSKNTQTSLSLDSLSLSGDVQDEFAPESADLECIYSQSRGFSHYVVYRGRQMGVFMNWYVEGIPWYRSLTLWVGD
jgi:hypothetical protein